MFRRNHAPALTVSLLSAFLLAGCATPEPLADINASLARQQEEIPAEILGRPLTVDDAVRLAVAHNLDSRLKLMEEQLAAGKADLARFALLPNLSVNGALTLRSAPSQYRSTDTTTGVSGNNYSTSEDKQNATADLSLSWNLVDLGLALLRSDQEDDRVLLAAEKRRRAMHLLVQDVRTAYWKAVVNETAERRYKALEARLESSVDTARAAEADRLNDPLQMLAHQHAVIETMRQIAELQRQTATARTELAGLMGVPSAASFHLEELAEDAALTVSPPVEDLGALEVQALADRPETHSDALQFNIDVQDVRAEMLRTLPGIGPFLGGHYDSTSFLLQNLWADAGLHLATSINDLITAPSRLRNARNTAELTRARRMVTAMAVLTQVHVADDLYRHAWREYRLTEQLADVDGRISHLSSEARKAGYGSEIEAIKARASSALSGLRRVQIYADLEAAKARMDAALGREPLSPSPSSPPADARPVATAQPSAAPPQPPPPMDAAASPPPPAPLQAEAKPQAELPPPPQAELPPEPSPPVPMTAEAETLSPPHASAEAVPAPPPPEAPPPEVPIPEALTSQPPTPQPPTPQAPTPQALTPDPIPSEASPSAPAERLVRLASYRSEKDAREGWAKLRAVAPALSGEPVLRRFDAGVKGVFTRLFARARDDEQVRDICRQTARMISGCTVSE